MSGKRTSVKNIETAVRDVVSAFRFARIDIEWERRNPFLKGVQSRFRSNTLMLDILLNEDAHHENAFRRRRRKRYRGMNIWFPSAEDLILLKLRAGRPTDFDDVIGIIERIGAALDLPYLSAWARRLGIIQESNYVIDWV
jgi:hypothetical protein